MTKPDENGALTCPDCSTVNLGSNDKCCNEDCNLNLGWISADTIFGRVCFSNFAAQSDDNSTRESISKDAFPRVFTFSRQAEQTIGRLKTNDFCMPRADVRERHAVIYHQQEANQYWIAAVVDDAKVWINAERKITARLNGGDLIQIGPYAFVFNSIERCLSPVGATDSKSITVENLKVPTNPVNHILGQRKKLQGSIQQKSSYRLDIESLQIGAGEFTAIVGGSGSGKSTLLTSIAGINSTPFSGTIRIGAESIEEMPLGHRSSVLGYVPQHLIVHEHLSAKESLIFSMQLRGKSTDDVDDKMDNLLRQLQIPRERWNDSLYKLSGGEKRRICTAVELLSDPQVLLLDEPGSGLDDAREHELMKALRNLSLCGRTVVLVSHNNDMVKKYCTRLIVIKEGKVAWQGNPTDFPFYHTMSEFPDQEASPKCVNDHEESPNEQRSRPVDPPVETHSFRAQFGVLVKREYALIKRQSISRFFFPVVVLPIIFAIFVGISCGPTAIGMFWFLGVLSSIWLGASLSLLTVVDERGVFEHERHLYLGVAPYLLAKFFILSILGILQISVFANFVCLVRFFCAGEIVRSADFDNWRDLFFIVVTLLLVNLAAIASGLLISALADNNRKTANLILPLLMIAQMVFSVPVCINQQDPSLSLSYMNGFHLHACAGSSKCKRQAVKLTKYEPLKNLWLCERCNGRAHSLEPSSKAELTNADLTVDVENKIRETGKELEEQKVEDSLEKSPNRIATATSYLMLSRYGDIAIRSVIRERLDKNNLKHLEHSDWLFEAWITLLLFTVGQVALTLGVIVVQTRRRIS